MKGQEVGILKKEILTTQKAQKCSKDHYETMWLPDSIQFHLVSDFGANLLTTAHNCRTSHPQPQQTFWFQHIKILSKAINETGKVNVWLLDYLGATAVLIC